MEYEVEAMTVGLPSLTVGVDATPPPLLETGAGAAEVAAATGAMVLRDSVAPQSERLVPVGQQPASEQ